MLSLKSKKSNLFQTIWNYLNSQVFVILTFIIALFILAKTSDNYYNWTGQNTAGKSSYNIYSDGSGYYNYLPQWFIYKTDNLKFLNEIESKYPKSRFGDGVYFNEVHNKKTNKYYSGTAVVVSPFFLIAHSIESVQNGETDGYSNTYQLLLSIAALFYWLIGAICIYLLLLKLKIPKFYAVFAIYAITFGSNLSHYLIYAPSYSHVYSFACVSLILLIAERWVATSKNNYFYLLGFLLGLSFLIRPTNLIILVFIPFLFENHTVFFKRIKLLFTTKVITLFIFLLICSLPFIFHFWITYRQIGDFKLNTYNNEGFHHLLNPFIFEILFGIRKGIFIYAPALLLSTLGLIYLYKLRRNLFWGFLILFSVFTYITASWWCWWYGEGFSMRPFIDIVGVFAIPLAFLLYHTNIALKFLSILLIFVCIYLTQTYSYQVSRNILHYENINSEHFSDVFLQTDKRFQWHPFLQFDTIPKNYSEINRKIELNYHNSSSKGKLNNLSDNDYFDYLSVTIKINSKSDDLVAGRINGWYKILDSEGTPCYNVTYYLNDTVKEESICFGSLIPEVGEEKYLSLDISPEIQTKNLDSIKIQMGWPLYEVSVKDIHFNLLKKKGDKDID